MTIEEIILNNADISLNLIIFIEFLRWVDITIDWGEAFSLLSRYLAIRIYICLFLVNWLAKYLLRNYLLRYKFIKFLSEKDRILISRDAVSFFSLLLVSFFWFLFSIVSQKLTNVEIKFFKFVFFSLFFNFCYKVIYFKNKLDTKLILSPFIIVY